MRIWVSKNPPGTGTIGWRWKLTELSPVEEDAVEFMGIQTSSKGAHDQTEATRAASHAVALISTAKSGSRRVTS